jgi:hypothetical protein
MEFCSGGQKRRDHLKDLGVNGMIILKWILNAVGKCGLDSYRSGQGLVTGSFEHGNDLRIP